MASDARRLEPSVRVTGRVAHGEVVPALREASGEASMAVVGRRGHGGFARMLAGSTSMRLAAEATVPVTVVHGHGPRRSPIVVGIDGSPGSEVALGLVLDEARLQACPVVAVLAYAYGIHPWLTDGRRPPPDPQLLHASALAALESTVTPWRDKFPDVAIRTTAAATPPVPFLTDLFRHARLMIVGAHGHDHPTGTLGSVPERLLHRADCPVLIVR